MSVSTFQGIICIAGTDINGYIVTEEDFDMFEQTYKGKPVLLEFEQDNPIGEVISLLRVGNQLSARFTVNKSSGMEQAVANGVCKPCVGFNLDLDDVDKFKDAKATTFMAIGLCSEPLHDLPAPKLCS